MNYRHAFHAGNFADVHKHIVLLALLGHLHKKATPFFVLDTHAGRGTYDHRSVEAMRGAEWQNGIGLMQSQPAPQFAHYLDLVTANGKSYPGSPLLIVSKLRATDRAVFVEKHPEEAAALKVAVGRRKHVAVLEGDGYAALKAQLPPRENRGLVLIDPPYEADTEFADVAKHLLAAHGRWPNGMYALWYPIKAGSAVHSLHRSLIQAGMKKILLSTLNVRPDDSPLGLNGSGMLLVNPPWQLDEQLRDSMPALQRILAPNTGNAKVEWLAGE